MGILCKLQPVGYKLQRKSYLKSNWVEIPREMFQKKDFEIKVQISDKHFTTKYLSTFLSGLN